MPIISEDLKIFRSSVISDAAGNGGRMNAGAEVVSGVRNNILPNTTQAERTSGITRMRKVFCANRNDGDTALQYPYVYLLAETPAEDLAFLVLGDWRDTQADIDLTLGQAWRGGVGALSVALDPGDTTVVVEFESVADPRVHPNATEAPEGNRGLALMEGSTVEVVEWTSYAVVGDTVEYTLAAGVTGTFTTAAKVANVYAREEDVTPTVEDWTETADGDGEYDEAGSPLELHNVGTIDDDWTITFTSETAFEIAGLISGVVGTGNVSGDAAPINADTATPYFTLPAAGWSGTWAADDTVTFTTRPAAIPFWLVQHVPAATPSYSANETTIRFGGESA